MPISSHSVLTFLTFSCVMSTPQTGGSHTAPPPQISIDGMDKPIQDKGDGLQQDYREPQLGESQFVTVEIDTQATDGYDELQQDYGETHSEKPQLSSVEIDTQATGGYDEAQFNVEALMHASNTLNALPMCHNPKPRYQILELPDEPLNFKYENPNIKPNMQTAVQPRPPLSTAGTTIIQAHHALKDHHTTENVAQREVIRMSPLLLRTTVLTMLQRIMWLRCLLRPVKVTQRPIRILKRINHCRNMDPMLVNKRYSDRKPRIFDKQRKIRLSNAHKSRDLALLQIQFIATGQYS